MHRLKAVETQGKVILQEKVIPQGKHQLQDVGAWPLSQLGNSGVLLHALTRS